MHQHTHEHRHSRLGLIILFNLVITAAEYIGGFFSGSLSLVSDAGHNLSDVFALILGFLGEKVSEVGPSEKYSFGLKRIEIFTALVNSLVLVGIGVFIVIESIRRFRNPSPINLGIMLIVATIGFAGNFLSILMLHHRDTSLNLRAAYLHLLYDTVSSVAVIITGIIIYFTGFLPLDLIMSLLISGLILVSGFSIIRESFNLFIQSVPSSIDFANVYRTILSAGGVCSIHELHIWGLSSSEAVLSCHVCLADQKSDSDSILKKIKRLLEEQHGIRHVTIQIENTDLCMMDELCQRQMKEHGK